MNRLAIDCEKDYQKRAEKKVHNQPLQRNEILRTVANKTVQNDGFIVTEWNRKDRFLIPQNTVIISQTKNWNIGEIERTLEKLVKSSPNHTFEIILYDEPTTGLDPIMADVINDLIATNSKELGATTITITHDMASARKIADKIAMLYEGKIIWFGNVADIGHSGNEYVDKFVSGRDRILITK